MQIKKTVRASVEAQKHNDAALSYIRKAIECLGEEVKASDSIVAKESIANLSVVLFDLQK